MFPVVFAAYFTCSSLNWPARVSDSFSSFRSFMKKDSPPPAPPLNTFKDELLWFSCPSSVGRLRVLFVFVFFVFFNPKKSSHRQTDMARLLVLVNSVVLLLFGSDVFLVGASKYESKSISQSTVRFCSPVKKRFCAPWRCVYGHPFVHSLTVLWITLLACAKVIRGLIDYSVERK